MTSEAYADLGGAPAPSTAPKVSPAVDALIARLAAAGNRNLSAATVSELQALLGGWGPVTASIAVGAVCEMEPVPRNLIKALKEAMTGKSGNNQDSGVLSRDKRVDEYWGKGTCPECGAAVICAVENVGHRYESEKERVYIETYLRVHYTCGYCGRAASKVVPWEEPRPTRWGDDLWNPSTEEENAARRVLQAEIGAWYADGLAERITPAWLAARREAGEDVPDVLLTLTSMSYEGWERAWKTTPNLSCGCKLWDYVMKKYIAAYRAGRLRGGDAQFYLDLADELRAGREKRLQTRRAS